MFLLPPGFFTLVMKANEVKWVMIRGKNKGNLITTLITYQQKRNPGKDP